MNTCRYMCHFRSSIDCTYVKTTKIVRSIAGLGSEFVFHLSLLRRMKSKLIPN